MDYSPVLAKIASALGSGAVEDAVKRVQHDPVPLDDGKVSEQLSRILRQHGSRDAALEFLTRVSSFGPRHATLLIQQFDMLCQAARRDAANAVLNELRMAGGVPSHWRIRLDRPTEAAAPVGSDGPLLRYAAIRRLIAAGDADTAAERLCEALDLFPENSALNVQDVQVTRLLHGAAEAVPVAQYVALRFEDALAAQLALAECQKAAARSGEALKTLQNIVERFPDASVAAVRLARAYLEFERREEALERAQAACALDPGSVSAGIVHADALIKLGQKDKAIAVLDGFVAQEIATPTVMLKLVNAHIANSDNAKALSFARLGLDRFPGNAPLLERLVHLGAASGGSDSSDLDRIAMDLPPDRLRRVRAKIALDALDFEGALALARAVPNRTRTTTDVVLMARILIGANRNALAARYLRMSLGVLGPDSRLVSLFAQASNRIGQADTALARLETIDPDGIAQSPAILSNLMLLNAAAGRADAAAEQFRACIAMGGFPFQNAWSMLLRCLVAAGRQDLLTDLLEARDASGLWSQPHLQKTYHGQLLTEIKIALAMGDDGPMRPVPSGDHAGHLEYVEAFRDSNVSAMRYIEYWRRSPAAKAVRRASSPIPRTVYQYWDKPHPPEAIAQMIATWQGADGLEHQLFDRRSAALFLRDTLGDTWLRAFRMARNPAEESDYLRLCVLAMRGGVYADADDMLVGPIDRLIGGDAGLVLVLEAPLCVAANNFLAASPDHSALRIAALMARDALLSRASETTWSKTGPGLLSRALAVDLVERDRAERGFDLKLLTMADLDGVVSIHNPAAHKRSGTDWRGETSRQLNRDIAALLTSKLATSSDPASS